MAPPNQHPDDGETFFEALAGRGDGYPGARALREAIQAEARTLREAESARSEELSDAERARMDTIKQRLIEAGVFRKIAGSVDRQPPAPSASSTPARQRSLWDGLRELLFGGTWQRPLALAASLLLATVLVLHMGLPQRDEAPDVMRGEPHPAIETPAPAEAVRRLKAELTAVGAEVVSVQINDGEWALEVSVPDASNVTATQRILRDAGFRLDGSPPYQLVIRTLKP